GSIVRQPGYCGLNLQAGLPDGLVKVMGRVVKEICCNSGWGLVSLLCLVLALPVLASETSPSTADHGKFKALQGPFEKPEDVTAACLRCHTEAGEQIRQTTHWTWLYDHQETGQVLGKSKVINSFCGMAVTNEPRCTSCHVGYGWKDMNQPPPQAENAVDCLVCHDTTGDYWKFPTLAG